MHPHLPRSLSALLCVAVLAGCVTRSTDVVPLRVEGWTDAGAVRVASTGNWHCYVSAAYNSGITLQIWRTDRGYRLAFEKPEWSLEKDAVYDVTLSIDDLWQSQLAAGAVAEAIVIPLGLDDEALSALRRGRVLTLQAAAETFRFELEREAATLDRLESCYRKRLTKEAAAAYRNPFAAAQNPFKTRPRVGTLSGTPTVMKSADLERLFYRATGMEFRVEQASGFTPAADLVYFLGDYLYGHYWEQAIEAGGLDHVLSLTLASMQTDCSGRAVSGRIPGRENDLAKLRRGFVTCEADDFFADVLILANEPFAMTFVTSSSLDDAALADQVGAAVGASFVP